MTLGLITNAIRLGQFISLPCGMLMSALPLLLLTPSLPQRSMFVHLDCLPHQRHHFQSLRVVAAAQGPVPCHHPASSSSLAM